MEELEKTLIKDKIDWFRYFIEWFLIIKIKINFHIFNYINMNIHCYRNSY